MMIKKINLIKGSIAISSAPTLLRDQKHSFGHLLTS
jgi:hypothetical protein